MFRKTVRIIIAVAAIIVVKKLSCAKPKATNNVDVKVIKIHIKTTIVVVFFEVAIVAYQDGNRKFRYWFIAIPRTEEKEINMQITVTDKLSS